jgi:hypothetical protein
MEERRLDLVEKNIYDPPQLSQPVEKPPAGPQWVHEVKLDGYRMAADPRRARLDREISERHRALRAWKPRGQISKIW